MPSFDIISEVDLQEVRNAVDQCNRELRTRFDFRNVDSGFEFSDGNILVWAEQEFQVIQLREILYQKCAARKVDQKSLSDEGLEHSGKQQRLRFGLKQGIDRDSSKQIVGLVKRLKLKVQTQILGEKLRVTGKKKDDLQAVMQQIRELDLEIAVQFNNFRD